MGEQGASRMLIDSLATKVLMYNIILVLICRYAVAVHDRRGMRELFWIVSPSTVNVP